MARFDLSWEELRDYRPDVRVPGDFDAFWARTLAESRAAADAGGPVIEPADTPATAVGLFDVTFPGFAGDPIKAWLALPAGVEPASAGAGLPGVVEYLGYGGGRGLAHTAVGWALAGFAFLLMDTRGQGSGWSPGDTPDPHGSGPAASGVMTRGIESPDTYYYRRLIADAVRAVDALRAVPAVDPARVSVTGTSQGGGLTLAVAGLVDGLVAACPNVPFLCHFERAVGLTDNQPYAEIRDYLRIHRDRVDQTFDTLSYVDGANFALRATAPALFSTALEDQTCPPSTVFAAFNRYGAPGSAAETDKEIVVYPFNDHEGGAESHWPRSVAFVRERLARLG